MSDEFTVSLDGVIRSLHMIDATKWLGSGSAFWLEWNHPGERPQNFKDIVKSVECWAPFIKPGSTCMDIGSHSGDTTIPIGLMAFDKSTGRKGRVIAVEPNPDIHPLLEAALAINSHVANFSLVKCAVTATDVDEVELVDHGNSNCNGGIGHTYSESLTEKLDALGRHRYKTCGKSLDSILADLENRQDIEALGFIKLDCEGYDKEILRSSKSVLSNLKPVVFAEWFAWFAPEDDADFRKAIQEVDYVAFHPWRLKPLNWEERCSDVMCIHRDRIREFGLAAP